MSAPGRFEVRPRAELVLNKRTESILDKLANQAQVDLYLQYNEATSVWFIMAIQPGEDEQVGSGVTPGDAARAAVESLKNPPCPTCGHLEER